MTDIFTRASLIEKLASNDVEVLSNAMRRLEFDADDKQVPFLTNCLLDVCEGVRAAARRTLSNLSNDSAVFHLIDTVPDPCRDVYLSAMRAICEVDDHRPLVCHV